MFVSLDGARGCNHLIAWEQYPHVEPILEWRLVSNEELPDIALDRDFVETLFDSVPHKSRAEMEEEANRHAQSMRIGRWLVFVWAVVVPAGVALLEWWSDLLGLVVVIYALLKAGVIGLRLTGRLPKSDAERRREAEELQMRHHHYHCKRNPKGFARLKADNFRRWEIERTLAEAHELKASAPPRSVDG